MMIYKLKIFILPSELSYSQRSCFVLHTHTHTHNLLCRNTNSSTAKSALHDHCMAVRWQTLASRPVILAPIAKIIRGDSPVLDGSERLLVGDVIHEDEAHGSTIVRRGDGAVSLLTGSILKNTHKTALLVQTLA